MNKFINAITIFDLIVLVAFVLTFAAGVVVGQQLEIGKVEKLYTAAAGTGEDEVIYYYPHKAVSPDVCSGSECDTHQLINSRLYTHKQTAAIIDCEADNGACRSEPTK